MTRSYTYQQNIYDLINVTFMISGRKKNIAMLQKAEVYLFIRNCRQMSVRVVYSNVSARVESTIVQSTREKKLNLNYSQIARTARCLMK